MKVFKKSILALAISISFMGLSYSIQQNPFQEFQQMNGQNPIMGGMGAQYFGNNVQKVLAYAYPGLDNWGQITQTGGTPNKVLVHSYNPDAQDFQIINISPNAENYLGVYQAIQARVQGLGLVPLPDLAQIDGLDIVIQQINHQAIDAEGVNTHLAIKPQYKVFTSAEILADYNQNFGLNGVQQADTNRGVNLTITPYSLDPNIPVGIQNQSPGVTLHTGVGVGFGVDNQRMLISSGNTDHINLNGVPFTRDQVNRQYFMSLVNTTEQDGTHRNYVTLHFLVPENAQGFNFNQVTQYCQGGHDNLLDQNNQLVQNFNNFLTITGLRQPVAQNAQQQQQQLIQQQPQQVQQVQQVQQPQVASINVEYRNRINEFLAMTGRPIQTLNPDPNGDDIGMIAAMFDLNNREGIRDTLQIMQQQNQN